MVPLTVVYSRAQREGNRKPGLLHAHGAYGEMLDKRWLSELKSLLGRGWVLAYADVRSRWRWKRKEVAQRNYNSVKDYIHCAKFLVENNIVQENKLAGRGYSAGGLVVTSAINHCPDLFQSAVTFLDPTHTLIHPNATLNGSRLRRDVLYPAVLVTSSFNTRFGVWEAGKWVARVRDNTFNDPERPLLLNLTIDIVEENRFLQT
ncbi:BnaC07g16410D [Brassica napus]|uniref:Prolyl endopeptidase n=1 Tax=Brassica napus TaxID=3708 RepID=A0A078FIJ2_BRANA|nr:BnaC07g16410D [Brassica napus]